MSRILIETTMWDGPKFVDAPYLACVLHIKALSYAANALTDGFIPASKAREFVKKASSRDFQNGVDHLTTTQPGCQNPSWEVRPGGWYIHDYDDPLYANPLHADYQHSARGRQMAGRAGGLQSAASRRAKYGSAQPKRSTDVELPSSTPEATAEAPARSGSEANASANGQTPPEANPERFSKLQSSPDPSLPLPSTKKAPPTPSVSTALLRDAIQNGHTDDLALQYATRAGELLGRALAPLEVSMCGIFLEDFAYLSVDDMLQRMHDHVEHCKANNLPTPHKLHGFRKTLRLENEHRADARAPKAWRAEPIALAHVMAQRDPDE